MRYEWFIAKRYLKPEGRVTFIFIIALLSMVGVALGVAALIVVLSVMNGFATDLRVKILGGVSHLVYSAYAGSSLPDSPDLPSLFLKDTNVEAAAPLIDNFGLAQVEKNVDKRSYAVAVRGIDPAYENLVTDLGSKIIAGSTDRLLRRKPPLEDNAGYIPIIEATETEIPGILIGKELARYFFDIYTPRRASKGEEARAMETALGRTIIVTAPPQRSDSPEGSRPRNRTLEVVGVFSTGHYDFDLTWVYVSIPTAQYLYSLPGRIDAVMMRLRDYSENATWETAERVRVLAESYNLDRPTEERLEGGPRTWMDINRTFFEALVIEKRVMAYILRIIILVATFNILTTLFMVGMVKTRDIGLLRAVGATKSGILRIFLMLGCFIGSIGVSAGLAVGLGICEFIRRVGIQLPGEGQIYYLQYLPVRIEWGDIAGVVLYTLGVSLITSLFPAYWAARQQPVDSLRYG